MASEEEGPAPKEAPRQEDASKEEGQRAAFKQMKIIIY